MSLLLELTLRGSGESADNCRGPVSNFNGPVGDKAAEDIAHPIGDRRSLTCVSAWDILGSVGSVYILPPEEIPFSSALCSCGPALYATMLEALADTMAAHRGYDRELCRRMVRETALGTLLLQDLDGVDASEVVKRVAHPGGPSESGVAHLRATLPELYNAMLQEMRKW